MYTAYAYHANIIVHLRFAKISAKMLDLKII